MNQNNMSQKNLSEWKIDNRTENEVEERIAELAAAYVPEWHFDRENPDIGAVIAKVYAKQMAGNIGRYNQVLEKYHTAFVNMLGISLLPARPASATVLMTLVQDTIPGVGVQKGTKLLAEQDEDGEPIIFETAHNLYVTSSELESVFMTEENGGKIVPLKGKFEKPELFGKPEEEREEEEEDTDAGKGLTSFRLFHSGLEGIEQNALLYYHSVVLDVENDNIYFKIKGNPKLADQIRNGLLKFYYATEEGLIPVEKVLVQPDGENIVLQKEKENAQIELDGKPYSLLVLKAEKPVRENLTVSGIQASSSGRPVPIEFAGSGSVDYEVEAFEPFGDTLSLFQECYLGHNGYFGKAGSLIRLSFDVSYQEHRIQTVIQGEDPELKIIKRKPKVIWTDSAADARVEEITFEYFNGIGWKKLKTMQETRRMFADEQAGRYEISFICPEDWEETGAGAYQGRCIRMQVLKSDNCYMRPCVHHYPKVRNMRVSFSYENHYMDAERLFAVSGTKRLDLTKQVKEGKSFTAFSRGEYSGDALYLGFSRRMEGGPVSILFQMEEGIRFEGTRCRFEYSTARGFKQMKVLDYTVDMSRSGTVMFMPQADMAAVTIEGKKQFWLRISPVELEGQINPEKLPVIRDICINAVQVNNVETRDEEDFYLEESVPDMTVNLGVANILDVEVWVNEKGKYTRPQMQKLLKENPDNVRAEYDIMGEISSFFVKWQETDNFSVTPSRRCYLLDRMNSRITFGDGLRVEIPSVLDDVAFKVRIRCCNGQSGNVGPGQIQEALGNLVFVDQITNPVKAYGGSNIENLENALKRGANIIKSRKRLVSVDDYVQEILSFSDTIDQVRCVTGETIHGEKKDGAVTFVVLLKDFAAGSYSFHSVAGALKRHLCESCELTIKPEDLYIVEPIFAKVSVDVWAEVLHMDDSFEIQNLLQESLEQYLDPVSSGRGDGWEIGTIPKKSQILMRLNILKSKAVIKKMVVTVAYTDGAGTHEMDLEDMKENPFVVCQSGRHRVNIMISEKYN